MKIVIDISKESYDCIVGRAIAGTAEPLEVTVANGTPLPKEHGRLVDENEIIDEIVCEEIDGRYYDVIYAHSIYDASTIIEADKGEEK